MGMQSDVARILDEYLVVSSQAGSRAAFEELARRWMPRLVRYSARTLGRSAHSQEDVREIVQETWVAAIRGLRRLEDPANFPAWIYTIAARKCADSIRAAARRRRSDARLATSEQPPRAADDADAWGRSRDLADAIAHLPETERSVVHLYYGEDLDIAEVAAVLGVPAGTVKSRLHHAREVLKRSLVHEPLRKTS
jgi:RNA polymerase sigma-70 factor (ECF subfamily)